MKIYVLDFNIIDPRFSEDEASSHIYEYYVKEDNVFKRFHEVIDNCKDNHRIELKDGRHSETVDGGERDPIEGFFMVSDMLGRTWFIDILEPITTVD